MQHNRKQPVAQENFNMVRKEWGEYKMNKLAATFDRWLNEAQKYMLKPICLGAYIFRKP